MFITIKIKCYIKSKRRRPASRPAPTGYICLVPKRGGEGRPRAVPKKHTVKTKFFMLRIGQV